MVAAWVSCTSHRQASGHENYEHGVDTPFEGGGRLAALLGFRLSGLGTLADELVSEDFARLFDECQNGLCRELGK